MPLMPRVIAHRGARTSAPENTIPAIREAKKLGSSWIEIDVMLSADGTVFLNHDRMLERCSNGVGFFHTKTDKELLQLDVGSWFAPEFAGTRFPTLIETVRTCEELGMGIDIEIKHLRVNADDYCAADSEIANREREIACATCKVLQGMNLEPSVLDKVIVSSFSTHALEVVQRDFPALRRVLLVEAIPSTWKEDYDRLGCESLSFNHKKATMEEILAIRDAGITMYSYTVNDGSRAQELISWGVKGVFADNPGELEEYLQFADDIASKDVSKTLIRSRSASDIIDQDMIVEGTPYMDPYNAPAA